MIYKHFIIIIFSSITLIASNVSGLIVDDISKQPISDVNIIADHNGTVTDSNGEFKLQTNFNYITVDHIGYHKRKILVNEYLLIELSPKVIVNNEILVISSLKLDTLINSVSSLTIFKENDVKLLKHNHFQNLIDYIPNLNWAGGTSRPRYFQIRGIGERSQYFGEGSPNFSIGYIIDDIDLSGIGMIGGLNDMSQIEVSKGSQSTVYGNNAIGGSITMKSNDPSEDFQLNMNAGMGSDNFKEYGFIANFKLLNGNYLRVNASKNYQNGFRENDFLGKNNTNMKDELFFRLKLKLVPNQRLSFINTFISSDMKNGYDAWAPDNNEDFKTYTDQPGEDSQQTSAFSSRAVYKGSGWNFVGIISRSSSDLVHSYDGDWANNLFWEDTLTYGFDPYYYGYYSPYQFFDKNIRNRKTYTNEIRIVYKSNIIGIYNKRLKEKDMAKGWLFGGNSAEARSEHDINIISVYAQGNFNISKKISNTTSLRHENNDVKYSGRSFGYSGDELPEVSSNEIFELTGFKTAFRYKINNLSKAYLFISKGYKSGGVNQQPYISDINRNYSPEYLTSYEIGYNRFSKNSSLRLSSFYGVRSEQQVSVSAQQIDNDPNSFYYFTANSGTGWMKGVELEQNLNISKNISIRYSIGYLDTWIEEFSYEIADGIFDNGGNRKASMSPDISSSFTLTYQNNGNFFRLSHCYKGDYYYSDSHDNKTNAYSIENLSFGRNFNNVSLSIWVNNMFDKRYPVRGFYFGLLPPNYEDQLWISYGDPFQAGVSIEYSY